jgi:hypothetical protein
VFTRFLRGCIRRAIKKVWKHTVKKAAKMHPKGAGWKVAVTWYKFANGERGSVIVTAPTLRKAYHKLAEQGYKTEAALAEKTTGFETYVGWTGIYTVWKSRTEVIEPAEPEQFQDEDGTIWVPDTTDDEETDDHTGSEVQETPAPDSEDSFLDTSSPWSDS